MYCPRLPSRSEWAAIRHHHYHLRHWGTPQPNNPPLLMLHGWMDVSASFQFVVDALVRPRHIIAPDWRGFGLTRTAPDPGATATTTCLPTTWPTWILC